MGEQDIQAYLKERVTILTPETAPDWVHVTRDPADIALLHENPKTKAVWWVDGAKACSLPAQPVARVADLENVNQICLIHTAGGIVIDQANTSEPIRTRYPFPYASGLAFMAAKIMGACPHFQRAHAQFSSSRTDRSDLHIDEFADVIGTMVSDIGSTILIDNSLETIPSAYRNVSILQYLLDYPAIKCFAAPLRQPIFWRGNFSDVPNDYAADYSALLHAAWPFIGVDPKAKRRVERFDFSFAP